MMTKRCTLFLSRRDLPLTQVYPAATACELVDTKRPAKKTAEMNECAHSPPKNIAWQTIRIVKIIMFVGCVLLSFWLPRSELTQKSNGPPVTPIVSQLVNMLPKCFCSIAVNVIKNPITKGVAIIVRIWATCTSGIVLSPPRNSIRSLSWSRSASSLL